MIAASSDTAMVATINIRELVQRAPARASAVLSNHYAAHRTAAAVAAELDVSVRTLKRWLAAVREAGYPIKESVRRRRGWEPGRPRGPGIARNFRGRKKKLPKR